MLNQIAIEMIIREREREMLEIVRLNRLLRADEADPYVAPEIAPARSVRRERRVHPAPVVTP